MDSQWILRYLERMGEVGLVPLMHAMDDTPEESLWKLASIARQLPDLTMIALDAFGGFEATRQCFLVAEVAPNVVFDTSLSYNFDFIEDFAVRFGAGACRVRHRPVLASRRPAHQPPAAPDRRVGAVARRQGGDPRWQRAPPARGRGAQPRGVMPRARAHSPRRA